MKKLKKKTAITNLIALYLMPLLFYALGIFNPIPAYAEFFRALAFLFFWVDVSLFAPIILSWYIYTR